MLHFKIAFKIAFKISVSMIDILKTTSNITSKERGISLKHIKTIIWPVLIIAQAIAFEFLFNFTSLLTLVNSAAFNMMRINSIDLFICSVQALWWSQICNSNNIVGFKGFVGALAHCTVLNCCMLMTIWLIRKRWNEDLNFYSHLLLQKETKMRFWIRNGNQSDVKASCQRFLDCFITSRWPYLENWSLGNKELTVSLTL